MAPETGSFQETDVQIITFPYCKHIATCVCVCVLDFPQNPELATCRAATALCSKAIRKIQDWGYALLPPRFIFDALEFDPTFAALPKPILFIA